MRQQPIIVMSDFQLPETAETERQVLADIVCAPDLMGEVLPMIHRDFFTSDFRRGIWDTIVDHYNRGEAFDMVTLTSQIGQPFRDEVIPKTSGAGMLLNTISHAALLRSGAAKRRAYIAATSFLQKVTNPATEENDLLSGVEAFAAQVEGPAPLNREKSITDVVNEVQVTAKGIEQARKEGRNLRISTGFKFMDDTLNGGFKQGQLVVLAARPGVGKTSLMLHFAKTAATNGFPVYIISLEMTDEELGEKLVYSTGKVLPKEITYGLVDWAAFQEARSEIDGLPILIDTFSRSLDEIVGRITQAVKRGRCRFVMIDYLGLIRDCIQVGGSVNLNQVLERITTTMKAVAKRLGITIMLLCQLNRENVRENHAPELFNLRGSGSIEQDADIVLMLDYDKKRNCVVAWLRKSRNGRHKNEKGEDFGFPLFPDESYSHFDESAPETESSDIPPLAPPGKLLKGPAYGQNDLPDENELPF